MRTLLYGELLPLARRTQAGTCFSPLKRFRQAVRWDNWLARSAKVTASAVNAAYVMEIKRGNRRNRPSFFIIKNLKVPQPVEAVGHARITHTVTYLLQGIQERTRLVQFPHTSRLNDSAKQPNVAHSPRFGLQPSRSIIDNEKAFGMLLGQANTAGFPWINAGMDGAPVHYLDTRFMQPFSKRMRNGCLSLKGACVQ